MRDKQSGDPHAEYLSAQDQVKREPRERPDGSFDQVVGADHGGERLPSASPGGLWAPKSRVGLNAITAFDASVQPWVYDANGFPVGPGGVVYTGSKHEFSGGLPDEDAKRVLDAVSAEGYVGPSYAQWLKEVQNARDTRGAGFKAKPPVADKAAADKAAADRAASDEQRAKMKAIEDRKAAASVGTVPKEQKK